MISFICVFFPAIIAVNILSKLQERKFSIYELLTNYILFEILILFIIEIVLVFGFGNKETILNSESFSNYFVIKYITISMALACVLPFIYEITRKNIDIKLNFQKVGSKADEGKKRKIYKNRN